jgi:hypothetical protein
MKNSLRRYSKFLFVFLVFCALVSLPWLTGDAPGLGTAQAKITEGQVPPDEAHAPLDLAHPRVQAAMAQQERHIPWLMALPDVVGTATGLTEAAQPAILVFVRRQVAPELVPSNLDGLPVVVQVTGEFVSMAPPPGQGPGGKDTVNPKSRFPRPVPIGISTGNEGECSAGTIGARVKKKGASVYALSNNHVYALENTAPIGSEVLQPGRYDTHCATDRADVIGTLDDFEPIVFSTSANNVIDAAIALSSATHLGNATPTGGYGMPKSDTASVALGAAVQKYGRTTKLTKGTITGINATVNVGYGASGTARFVQQIIVSAGKPFIKAGDSGSLLVTDPGRNPVGLLFAGTASGAAVANPIDPVLSGFGVTIDGE